MRIGIRTSELTRIPLRQLCVDYIYIYIQKDGRHYAAHMDQSLVLEGTIPTPSLYGPSFPHMSPHHLCPHSPERNDVGVAFSQCCSDWSVQPPNLGGQGPAMQTWKFNKELPLCARPLQLLTSLGTFLLVPTEPPPLCPAFVVQVVNCTTQSANEVFARLHFS